MQDSWIFWSQFREHSILLHTVSFWCSHQSTGEGKHGESRVFVTVYKGNPCFPPHNRVLSPPTGRSLPSSLLPPWILWSLKPGGCNIAGYQPNKALMESISTLSLPSPSNPVPAGYLCSGPVALGSCWTQYFAAKTGLSHVSWHLKNWKKHERVNEVQSPKSYRNQLPASTRAPLQHLWPEFVLALLTHL